MGVIDVWAVVANGLWIAGLAVLLAVFSWASWAAAEERRRLGRVLGRAPVRGALNLGLLLFCTGLAVTGRAWWESLLWSLLALAFAVQAGLAFAALGQR